MLEGKLDFMLGGADAQATPGDLVRLGMGMPHGIFNKSDQVVKVLFWVSPTQKLYDLFWGIHNMKEQNSGSRGGARRRAQHPLPAPASRRVRLFALFCVSLIICSRHSGRREAAIRNLEIPGLMLSAKLKINFVASHHPGMTK